MNFHILTLFPDMVMSGLHTSIVGRAAQAGFICIEAHNIRDYTLSKHGQVDDAPYGGGAGLVLQCQPVYDAYQAVLDKIAVRKAKQQPFEQGAPEQMKKPRVLYTSPAGRRFDQPMAKELAQEEDLIILCGHYEGIDERVLELIEAEEVSIGDYILTGGELAAMVMTDAISRMVPGVLSNASSGEEESFSEIYPRKELTKKMRREVYGRILDEQAQQEEDSIRLLEYPQYTRPEEFMGLKVPEVLLSGDHAKITAWRRTQSLERTRERRPDLLDS